MDQLTAQGFAAGQETFINIFQTRIFFIPFPVSMPPYEPRLELQYHVGICVLAALHACYSPSPTMPRAIIAISLIGINM